MLQILLQPQNGLDDSQLWTIYAHRQRNKSRGRALYDSGPEYSGQLTILIINTRCSNIQKELDEQCVIVVLITGQ
jgi:hypothetical protein